MEACVRAAEPRPLFRFAAALLARLWAAAAPAAGTEDAAREVRNREAERALGEHGDRILRLAYSYLHNTADAEEVLQDTMIRFLQAAPAFESPGHEKAWLLRVAANLSKNRLDYNRVRRADELSEELAAERREDLSFVWEAVKALPERYREAIHLFYCEGCSTAEIAGILGENEATVRSRLSRGRDKLRAVLKEAYDFGE